MARGRRRGDNVVVIGLGRFGQALAMELVAEGDEVLGIDRNPQRVEELTGQLTQVVTADATSEGAMRQLSVHEFRRAVIGVGTDVESSILAASLLLEFKVPQVWATAMSLAHARILERLGVHHVVRPQHDTGRRVAHLVRGRMLDYIEFEDGFALVKTTPPHLLVGRKLSDTRIQQEHGITVVAVKRAGQDFTYATADTVVRTDDVIIVSGRTDVVENIGDLQ